MGQETENDEDDLSVGASFPAQTLPQRDLGASNVTGESARLLWPIR